MKPKQLITTLTLFASLCGAVGVAHAQASPSRNNASKTAYPASGGAASGALSRDQVIAELYAARSRGEIPEICADYDVAHTRLRASGK